MDAEVIGSVAAFLTTVSFFPQVIQVLKTRDTSSISLAMYVIFSLGVTLWFVYGVMIGSRPVMVANVVTLAASLTILGFKIKEVLRA